MWEKNKNHKKKKKILGEQYKIQGEKRRYWGLKEMLSTREPGWGRWKPKAEKE